MKHGPQIGVIVYGGGLNVRTAVTAAVAAGYIVVWDSGFAAIYAAK